MVSRTENLLPGASSTNLPRFGMPYRLTSLATTTTSRGVTLADISARLFSADGKHLDRFGLVLGLSWSAETIGA